MVDFKKIYNYDPISLALVDEGLAQENPKRESTFLTPPNATDIEPLAPLEGHICIFKNEVWQHVKDHRGEIWFDVEGERVRVEQVGDPVDFGLSQVAPPPPLGDAKLEAKKSMIGYADQTAKKFTSKYSKAEQSTFIQRATEARAVKAGTLTPEDANYLLKLTKGVSADVAGLVDNIIAKADVFENVTVEISLLREAAEIAIDAAVDHGALDAVLIDLKTQADDKAAQLLAGV